MNNIITKNIGTLEFIELRDYMNMCIRNSIFACDDDGEKISVFKDCTMDEYFCEYQDIYDDNDVKVGIGVDTISHKFVLNEETRADFENAFCQARDAAYEEAIEDAINDIEEETENTLKIIELDDEVSDKELRMIDARAISEQQLIGERIDNECTKLELQGFKRVAYDSDEVVEFDSVFASDILERGGNNITIGGVAKYLGASVKVAYKGRNDFDYRDIYYKKED